MNDSKRHQKDRASRAHAEGRHQEAVALYRQILEDDPSELGVLLKIGDLEKKLNNVPASVDAYRRVARAYAGDGFLLKAIAVCKLILNLDRRHTETQSMLAELYAQRRATGPGMRRVGGAKLDRAPPRAHGLLLDDGDFEIVQDVPGSEEVGLPSVSSAQANVQRFWPGLGRRGTSPPIPLTRARRPSPSPIPSSSSSPGPIARALGSERPRPEDATPRLDVLDEAEPDEAPIELVVRAEGTGPEAEGRKEPDVARVHIPLFSELPREAFIDLLVRMDMRELRPGDHVIYEGDIGDSFFVLASGKVRVERTLNGAEPVLLAYLTDGAFFGEMALLQDGARTASVIAEEDSQIFEISKAVLDDIIGRYPYVARIMRDFYKHRLLSTAMATHPLFRPFDAAERRRLIGQFRSRAFQPGDVLLEQGKLGTGLYLLLHGKLRVSRQENGETLVLAELTTGDMFGEMSLLTGDPTVATVSALSECFVLRLGKEDFDRLIMTNLRVREWLAEISSARANLNDALLARRADDPVVLLV